MWQLDHVNLFVLGWSSIIPADSSEVHAEEAVFQ